MLKEPNTPLLAAPQVMRVLVLPYRGDQNELYMMRYVYLLTDDPKWVMGNYLIDSEEY
jgi:conjugal transfer pilus assembly protein TraV